MEVEPSAAPGTAQLRRKIGFSAGWVVRHMKSIGKLLPLFEGAASPSNVTALIDSRDKLVAQKNKVDAMYDLLFESGEGDMKSDVTALDNLSTQVDETLAKVAEILNRDATPAAPERTADPPKREEARIRPNDALKPFTLTKEHSPVEMANWVKQFKAYFTTSNFAACAVAEQQAYFRSVIDANLESRIADRVLPSTPVFSENANISSCVSILEEEFEAKYPLAMRRVDLFNCRQSEGQLFSDFAANVRAKADRANLHELTPNDVVLLIYITGCRDKKLREKFLEEKEPTLTVFHEVIRQHESAAFAEKSLHKSKEESRITRTNQQGATPTFQELKADGRCTRCGAKTHKGDSCNHKSTTCNGCGMIGHIQRVCQSKNKKYQNKEKQGEEKRKDLAKSKRSLGKARQVERENAEDPPPGYESSSESENGKHKEYARVSKVERTMHTASAEDPRITLNFQHTRGSFRFPAVADSGTTITIIAKDIAERQRMQLQKTVTTLKNASNEAMKCEGQAFIRINGVRTKALVSSSVKNDILLSLKDMKRLGIVEETFPCLPVRSTKIENFGEIIEEIQNEFGDVIKDTLGQAPMKGQPMHIHLKDNAVPTKITTARKTPIHWLGPSSQAIERLIQQDILQVETDPTEWIAPGFFVPKGSPEEREAVRQGMTIVNAKDLRLVVDFTGINKYVKRPHWPFPSCQDIMDQIPPDSKVFAVMDCTAGYHQVPLDRESQKLTTFILPSGRYSFKRAPMGLNASSDEWCRRSDEAIHGSEGVLKLVDDILVFAPSLVELKKRIATVLSKCRMHNVTISKKKLKIGHCVKFAGFLVSGEGIKPDPERVQAIRKFPVPKSVTDVRSFLGLANQLGAFLPDLAQSTNRLRQLLTKKSAFLWLDEHQETFEKVKEILTSPKVVKFFDPGKSTELITDASKLHGMGFALLQKDGEGAKHLVMCGSRSLQDPEKNYAIVELESKAIAWAITKCRHYLMGMDSFEVITDHKPLMSLYDKPLDDVPNARVQRHRESLARYSFQVRWEPGKKNLIADALSRYPVFEEDADGNEETAISRMTKFRDLNLDSIKQAANDDDGYKAIAYLLSTGKSPEHMKDGHPAKLYQKVWHELSVEGDLIIKDGNKIVVPKGARREILEASHGSHSGITKTRELMRELYFWPGMGNDVRNMVEACGECQRMLPSTPKQEWMERRSERPMEQVGVDLFEFQGRDYLAMIDRYSGFLFFHKLKSTVTKTIITVLTKYFCDWGWPNVILSDGGPQFRSEFKAFCKNNGIFHETSSPYYPQSNGLSEIGVKMAKSLLQKVGTEEITVARALQELRNTPRADGYSPAQFMFNRRQRTAIPCHHAAYDIIDLQKASEARRKTRVRAKEFYDNHAVILRDLEANELVVVQNVKTKRWDITGEVIRALQGGRRYEIRTEDGFTITCNRRRVRPNSAHS